MPDISGALALQIAQALGIGLLWLFYMARWFWGQDRADRAVGVRMTDAEKTINKSRDRLHKLEGFQQRTETKLTYIERDAKWAVDAIEDLQKGNHD